MKHSRLYELFLIKYFSLEVILDNIVKDKWAMFSSLAKMYCISEECDLRHLYELTQNDDIITVDTKEAYERTLRVLDYVTQTRNPIALSKDTLSILTYKGAALELMAGIQKVAGGKPNEGYIFSVISRCAESQNIFMMGLMSYILFEGILTPKNDEAGKKLARKCAEWNDPEGILLLLYYDKNDTDTYLSMLYTIALTEENRDLFRDVFTYYNNTPLFVSENTNLMAKYLQRNYEANRVYQPQIARIVHSKMLTPEDKRRILFSGSKELVASVNDLPLGSGAPSAMVPCGDIEDNVSYHREEEARQLTVNLNLQRTEAGAKTPLIICSDSYVAEQYQKAIQKVFTGKFPIEKMNAAGLLKTDFLPTKDHFVLSRLLDANTTTGVFIIENVDKLEPDITGDFCKLIRKESRARFHLQDPRVNLNLSNCLFVLFSSDADIDERILAECQLIETVPLEKTEKAVYIEQMIEENTKLYQCEALSFDSSAQIELSEYKLTQTEAIISAICRKHSYLEHQYIVLSEEVQSVGSKYGDVRLGFRMKGDSR